MWASRLKDKNPIHLPLPVTATMMSTIHSNLPQCTSETETLITPMLSTEQYRTQDTNEITNTEHTIAKRTASFTARLKQPKLCYSTDWSSASSVQYGSGPACDPVLFPRVIPNIYRLFRTFKTLYLNLIPLTPLVGIHRRSKCDSFIRKFQYYDPQLWVFSEHFSRTVMAHVVYNGLIRHQK